MNKAYNNSPVALTELAESIAALIADPYNASLPDPEVVSYYRMWNERKIWLDAYVDLSILEIERQILLWNMEDAGMPSEQRRPIWIYIMNYGGSADCGWSMIDVIRASETPIFTVNMGQCASAAALIFMAGHKRFMMPGASVLIHEGSAAFEGDSTKVIDASESYRAMLKRMHQYIISRTSISQQLLSKKKNNDWELSCEMCVKYNVCDVVVHKLSDII